MEKQEALAALIATVNDRTQSVEVRAGAARGLGYIGGPQVRRELATVINDRTQNVEVRAAAAEALGQATAP